MKRKRSNSNKKITDRANSQSIRILTQKDDDHYVFIQQRGPEHRRALTRLEKKFGRGDFSRADAETKGIGRDLLRELIQFNQIQVRSDDRFAINQNASTHAVEFETPIHFQKATYAMFENMPDDSPLRKGLTITAERPKLEEEKEKISPFALDPMHVTKRFRMPYGLYLDIRADIENLSAYVRFLIYTDRGMEKEAQIEKDRMGDSTREDK